MAKTAFFHALGLSYRCCADRVIHTAGWDNREINMGEFEVHFANGMDCAGKLLEEAVIKMTGDYCEINI